MRINNDVYQVACNLNQVEKNFSLIFFISKLFEKLLYK